MGRSRGLHRVSGVVVGVLGVVIGVSGAAAAGVGTTEPSEPAATIEPAATTEPVESAAPQDPVATEPVATTEPAEPTPSTEGPDPTDAPDPTEAPTATTESPVSTGEPDDVFTPLALIDVPPNPGAITIPATGTASPYPSSITVSGQPGLITDVDLHLFGVTHVIAQDIDILLVGPGGQSIIVMSDAGSGGGFGVSNADLTFDDGAAGPYPNTGVVSGTVSYRPTNNAVGGDDAFPAPAPTPAGHTTLAAAFVGTNPNGTWSLYIVDDATGDAGSIAGGWSLTIDTEEAAVATTTVVTSSANPSLVGGSVTFTATVTRAEGSGTPTGTVSFQDGATSLGGPVALDASGQATLTTSALTEGAHVITATYSGAAGLLTSSGSITQTVDTPTSTPAQGQWCNTGAITGPASSGPATPYPSRITVSGAGTSTSLVTVQLGSVSHQVPVDFDVLLVGPAGQNLVLMSDVGGTEAASGATLTFADAAGGTIPVGGPLSSGTFRPSDSDADAADAPFPAPAPVVSSATALSTFNGTDPNGVWQLFVVDDAGADSGAVSGGWCLNITTPAPTTTDLTSSLNPSTFGQAVTFTATVTSDGSPVTSGSVTFTDGASTLGTVAVDGAGQATLTTSTLTVGSHPITAAYGATAAFEASSDSLSQVVNLAPTSTSLTSSVNPTTFGQSVTFTATVTSGGSPVTTGSVTFSDGASTLATVPVDASGQASFTTSALSVGSHTVTAAFGATATAAASSDSLTQVVNLAPTSTSLTSSVNPTTFGQSVTFTATVTSGGSPVTTGSVTYSDGASTLATVPVDASGQASLTTSALAVGSHAIVASFGPTTALAASSDSLTQVVDGVADAGGPYAIDEGQSLTLDGSGSIAGPGASYAWDVDDDGDFDDATGAAPTLSWAELEALGFDGDDPAAIHQVTLRLTDGVAFSAVTTLSIANVAPTATALDDDGPVAEGSTATVTITGADDPSTADLAALTYHFDFDDDGTDDHVGSSPTAVVPASYLSDGPGTRTVTAFVADPDGGASAELTTTITITNAAATATIDGPSSAIVGEPVTIKVGAVDPSPDDMAGTFMFTVDWGDGTPPVTLPGPADPPVTHTYTRAGTFTVVATVVDPDGTESEPLSFVMTVTEQVTPSTTSSTAPPTSEPPTTLGPTTSGPSPTDPTSTAPTSTVPGTLPTTGTSSSLVSVAALALLAAGAGALLATRRLR
ncbi:beta strand repeat-containing protein [Desertimonas flava]|uniref:beta strand repeat-containing protein n=1 Tax=Desertimonas flava TaxID=2064846 RepID=UPI0013C4D0F0|nr:Ig-like domain-containing protein [Desertimonas flava]